MDTIKKRSEIDDAFKWCLEDMYPTDQDWEKEYDEFMELAESMSEFEGKLSESADKLLAYFEKFDQLLYYINRLIVYSNERYHQDTTVSKYQAYAAKADTAGVAFESAVAFAQPELLSIPMETIEQFYKDQPKLTHYKRAIDEHFRSKDHILSTAEEALLAKMGELTATPSNIFSMFNDADIKFPSIRDVEGNRIQITHGSFIRLLEDPDRTVRKGAYENLYNTYKQWGNTVASIFGGNLKKEKFMAEVRKYPSVRAMHLDEGNVPEAVYDNLIETVHKHLPALHKYVGLRKHILDVEELHTYDLYVPIVEDVDKTYTFEEAKAMVLEAVKPMGEEYVNIMKEGFANRWIDVYENENKHSGAYSWAAYGTHPYVLLNFNGNLDSVFTLAHEMGHAIHSYYTNKTQSITYSEYLIFVAEVASTCNENLLMQYLLKKTTDPAERRYLINHYLEGFRGTVFRQCQFAEFEKIVHERTMKGDALTQDDFNQIYGDLVGQYYGDSLVVDDEIRHEWMRIPHFYTPFYVYQYSTGYSAATAFAKLILEGGQEAADRYINNFLCGGCSKDPIDLLAAAGVDLSTPKPIDDALTVFEDYLKMFEETM